MFSRLGKAVSSCLSPSTRFGDMRRADVDEVLEGDDDALLWSKDLEKHSHGEFSFAVVQGNATIEDHSQVETGNRATFVGVYDGHGGTVALIYVSNNLFDHLSKSGFLALVGSVFATKPAIATIGSCCMVGVIWKGTLDVANSGDSRAVIGYLDGPNKIVSEQLIVDHNASVEEVRRELMNAHPEDSEIIVRKQRTWHVILPIYVNAINIYRESSR